MSDAIAFPCGDETTAAQKVVLLQRAGYTNIVVIGEVDAVQVEPLEDARWLVVGTNADIVMPNIVPR